MSIPQQKIDSMVSEVSRRYSEFKKKNRRQAGVFSAILLEVAKGHGYHGGAEIAAVRAELGRIFSQRRAAHQGRT